MRVNTGFRDRSSLRIALLYAIISILWILFSDLLLVPFTGTRLITTLSIIKGWFFVIVTALLLYSLIRRTVVRIFDVEARMHLLFDSVNDAIFLYSVDLEGMPQSFIDINAAAERWKILLSQLKICLPRNFLGR